MKQLMKTLQISIAKNGEKPLTNVYLLNLLKTAEMHEKKESQRRIALIDRLTANALDPNQ